MFSVAAPVRARKHMRQCEQAGLETIRFRTATKRQNDASPPLRMMGCDPSAYVALPHHRRAYHLYQYSNTERSVYPHGHVRQLCREAVNMRVTYDEQCFTRVFSQCARPPLPPLSTRHVRVKCSINFRQVHALVLECEAMEMSYCRRGLFTATFDALYDPFSIPPLTQIACG